MCIRDRDFAGRLIDKVETLDQARDLLRELRGKTHRLHSAVVVARDGRPIWRVVETAKLSVRPFSDAWLEGYLQRRGEAIQALWISGLIE